MHHICQGNINVEVLLDRILMSASSHYLAQHLPKCTMGEIMQHCYKFIQVLEIIEVLWIENEIKGGIHRKIPVLKKRIRQNLFSVATAITEDSKKILLQRLEALGIKVKSKGTIDDYDIEDVQASEFKINPFVQTPHTSAYHLPDNRDIALQGNISLSNFKDGISNSPRNTWLE